jgi:hypothetical protein
MGQPGDLWRQIRTLQERVLDLEQQDLRNLLTTDDKFDALNKTVNGLVNSVDIQSRLLELATAHIENLIERVAELENPTPEIPCTCGWGGTHDPDNPRCDRNQRWVLPTPPE